MVEAIILFNIPGVDQPLPLSVTFQIAEDGSVRVERKRFTKFYPNIEAFREDVREAIDFVRQRDAKFENVAVQTHLDIAVTV